MSAGLWNATHEGGPRNGVATALDDWMASHDKSLRIVRVPIYFGLAIVVEAERLDRQPALAVVLDHLESAEGRVAQAELAEQIRLRAMANHHTVVARLREAATVTERGAAADGHH
jgi:aspartate-semialdehyde dehydrogenase